MLMFPPTKDDVCVKKTSVLFGHNTGMRLVSIAAFLTRHSPEDFERYDRRTPAQFLEWMMGALHTARVGVAKVTSPQLWRIDNLQREGSTFNYGHKATVIRKPKVVVSTEIKQRGGLSIMWYPNPKDYIAEDIIYHPSFSGRPPNEFVYFREFAEFANTLRYGENAVSPWKRAMIGHLILTFKLAIEEIVKEVEGYCEVKVAARLQVVRNEAGVIVDWEVVDQPELDARAEAKKRAEKLKRLESVRERIDETLRNRGLTAKALIERVEELRLRKMTFGQIQTHLADAGIMYPLAANETLNRIVSDLKKLFVERGELAEELGEQP
ncbi:hypothetical protein [Rhizobium leguminosarum]|uniref:hypothetical protein n=1 Tax=Rhizobium leguminosarum TaxID=384 RepID=UPI002E12525F|nr:hypothetical protein U8Q02_40310 [Rhizobium leguminosarum]